MQDNEAHLRQFNIHKLKEMAVLASTADHRYKKTTHGKNKQALIEYLLSAKKSNNNESNVQLLTDLRALSKEKLLQYCHHYPDFKKSYDRKSRDFHIDFLMAKKVDLSLHEISPEVKQLKELLLLKKDELLSRARKLSNFKTSMERRDKEFLARFLLNNPVNNETIIDDDLHKMSVKELREKAMQNPLFNASSMGKTKIELIKFLNNHNNNPVEPNNADEDDDLVLSPINIQEFLNPPDEQQLRDALTKILTSNQDI